MVMSIPQRILVAPSGFKESLDAVEVAAAISAGIRRVIPGVSINAVPMADGGEGTAAALASATAGKIIRTRVTGPVGEPVDSHFAVLGRVDRPTAVVEMAAAAGLRLVPGTMRNPGKTTTFGVGELILAALDQGVERIVVGCGDSGTSDGGAGALRALGVRILDAHGRELPEGGAALCNAGSVDFSGLDPRLAACQLELALNPFNVLCGPQGVARVFGPQKGATPDQVEELSQGLDRWAGLLAEATGMPEEFLRNGQGTGASGGLGAGLAAVGARLVPRFELLLDSGLAGIDLDAHIAKADLVVTAEGAIDFQTPRGKVPAEVARRAQRAGVPVLAFAGSIGKDAADVHAAGIDAIAGIIPIPMDLNRAVAEGAMLLQEATERTFRVLLLGSAISSRVGAAA
ncbi:glycerate kinase [Paenarthrobacter aurescens]|uniref:Glycerate kinase n=1 Tax=Paenarthrobacter aurescens TaxID=43663 RepID=A0A4Y3N8M3_PAEAU|nr:glycerate kinase [Paenarthrobacter aurescens]MDO6144732.1 glycerate kinase [Paenarthrobacter aurescens]MDO6148576.1 glycerate kinase [Paenarthrobacter aurescens]MDO6159823.1 glycerate kinase [Paenarthrobacter aurescens]MDO6163686.1 glycerate kinase [Paenarthrobacter aurescens]GEB17603.1 glycerate kinase [Paenarthrobacter aurescens]